MERSYIHVCGSQGIEGDTIFTLHKYKLLTCSTHQCQNFAVGLNCEVFPIYSSKNNLHELVYKYNHNYIIPTIQTSKLKADSVCRYYCRVVLATIMHRRVQHSLRVSLQLHSQSEHVPALTVYCFTTPMVFLDCSDYCCFISVQLQPTLYVCVAAVSFPEGAKFISSFLWLSLNLNNRIGRDCNC